MLVPILRAGVGMVAGVLRLLPAAEVGFIGLARNEETFVPQPYLDKLPDRLHGRPCFVLDPMLATGGSLEYTCRLLVDRGAPQPITWSACWPLPRASSGCEASGHQPGRHGRDRQRLNEHAYIIPGLGDAGDRLFGLW